jgi:hypothetical protein
MMITTVQPGIITALLVLVLVLGVPLPAQALSYQAPPVMDELASPFTESEVGGIGCIVASAIVGGGILYLMGGFLPIMESMAPPIHPLRVLEGSAAAAFVFSSACYIGVALAPLTMTTYTAITDSFVPAEPARSFFAPNNMGILGPAPVQPIPTPNNNAPINTSPLNQTSSPILKP